MATTASNGSVPAGDLDGRTARRDRNRLAVLDAMIALFAEDVEPSPEAVALRSGLSPRSVYRYFEDRDELVRAAIERQVELVMPLFLIHSLGKGSLDERIERFVHARLRLWSAVADASRAAHHSARRNVIMQERVATTQTALREQVGAQFAHEFDALAPSERDKVRVTVDTLTQFETIDYFRQALGLDLVATSAILIDALQRLLRTPPPTT
jgi:AcrR family transcriptional regulator